jgi:5-(carboxyamino)imidazole ribonucleotide synthase
VSALPPGKTLGVLGGGQLGRLIARAARGLGYRTAALDADPKSPALQVVDRPVVGAVDDPAACLALAEASDLVTLEWELIPAPALAAVEKVRTLLPGSAVLRIIQDRLDQKRFLEKNGFPQTPFGETATAEGLDYPVVIKRRRHGYDGKGQCVVRAAADAPQAAGVLEAPCVWEKLVDFEREISVILARTADGRTSCFPVAENLHRNGVLHATRVPARVAPEVEARARELATRLAAALGHVGVMAVELFLTRDGRLLVNEIAPRVHNSGHYTLGGCATSQFEQHVRAVCGLPLGPADLLAPATMVNLLGDLWAKGEPDWRALDAVPNCVLHLYGKSSARPGRKMGHYTVVGPAAAAEFDRADERLKALAR